MVVLAVDIKHLHTLHLIPGLLCFDVASQNPTSTEFCTLEYCFPVTSCIFLHIRHVYRAHFIRCSIVSEAGGFKHQTEVK